MTAPTAQTDRPCETTLMEHLVLAFGSNLDVHQMVRRCPGVRFVALGRLPGYRLTFGTHSGWGDGVATVEPTGVAGAHVEGALWALTEADLRALDGYEGAPRCYRREVVEVEMVGYEGVWPAWTYRMPGYRPAAPRREYLERIAGAYERLGFDLGALAEAARAVPAARRVEEEWRDLMESELAPDDGPGGLHLEAARWREAIAGERAARKRRAAKERAEKRRERRAERVVAVQRQLALALRVEASSRRLAPRGAGVDEGTGAVVVDFGGREALRRRGRR